MIFPYEAADLLLCINDDTKDKNNYIKTDDYFKKITNTTNVHLKLGLYNTLIKIDDTNKENADNCENKENINLSKLAESILVSSFNSNYNADSNDKVNFSKLELLTLPSDKTTKIKSLLYHLKNLAKANEENSNNQYIVVVSNNEMNRIMFETTNHETNFNSPPYEFKDQSLSLFRINKLKEVVVEFLNM